jgi:hypothetical protein
MQITRRLMLASLSVLAAPRIGRAQPALPPILFVHGNGDHAALWMSTLWRFESNGWPRDRLMAVNMPDPLARDDDAVPQPGRSGSAEQTERLAAFVRDVQARTGAARIALVGNSRGGYPIRDFVVHRGGAAQVSHAVLCGTPNRGVYDWPEIRNREFNSRSDFLMRLNGGATDVAEGTAFTTIRSDANDLFAQPRAVWSPATPDRPTGTDVDGPELRGALNIVLPGLDHARSPITGAPSGRSSAPLPPRSRAAVHRAGDAAGAGRPGHLDRRRRADQPPGRGRDGRDLARPPGDRRARGGGGDPPRDDRRPTAAGARPRWGRTGRWNSSSRRLAIRSRTATAGRIRGPRMSCTCAPRGR